MSEVEPLDGRQWSRLLAETGYVLRLSDGTEDGTWYFWFSEAHNQLYHRRVSFTQTKPSGAEEIEIRNDEDVTSQLVDADLSDWEPARAMTDGGTVTESASDGPTGPIIFSHPTAREQLVEEGVVYTFRTSRRTTGETHWRRERTGSKQGDVRVQFVTGGVRPGRGGLSLFADQSGFGTNAAWCDAIREVHGDGETLPKTGCVYRVEVLDDGE
jgi:hypothetical protein